MFTRISQWRPVKRSLSVLLDRVLLGNLARSTNTPLPVALWQIPPPVKRCHVSRRRKGFFLFFKKASCEPHWQLTNKETAVLRNELLLPVYRCARATHAVLENVARRILDLKHFRLQHADFLQLLSGIGRNYTAAPLSILVVLGESFSALSTPDL